MFDNKLYYQQNKERIKEYNKSYYYINAECWREYHNKYKQLERNINKKLLKMYFGKWKSSHTKTKQEKTVNVVSGPFIIKIFQ